jgi:hypothetical protein
MTAQCAVQVGLGLKIVQLGSLRSQDERMMTKVAHCAVLEGQGGQVIAQLHNSEAQGLGFSTEIAQCAVQAWLEGRIAQFWSLGVGLQP